MSLDDLVADINSYFAGAQKKNVLISHAEFINDRFEQGNMGDFKKKFLQRLGFKITENPHSSLTNIISSIIYYKEELSINLEEQKEITEKFPTILNLSVKDDPNSDTNIRTKVQYYQDELGITPTQIGSIIKKSLTILNLSVKDDPNSDTNIRTKVQYYHDELGITPTQLGNIAKKQPKILSYSVKDDLNSDTNVRAKVQYYHDELGITPTQLGNIIKKFPKILDYSVKDDPNSDTNIRTKVQYFNDNLGITPTQLGSIAKKLPSILGLSVLDDPNSDTNVRVKVDFYLNDYGMGRDEFKNELMKNPSIFNRSIIQNIEPKVYYLRLKNSLENFSITSITAYSDERFSRMSGDETPEQYKGFKENWIYLRSKKKLQGIQCLGLNKEALNHAQLTRYTKTQLTQAHAQIMQEGLEQELQANPNLIFEHIH